MEGAFGAAARPSAASRRGLVRKRSKSLRPTVGLMWPRCDMVLGDIMKVMACLASDLPPGRMVSIEILGRAILVVNVDGTFHAMDGICSHGLADLSKGRLDGHTVECPRHSARYDVRNGKAVRGPIGAEGVAHDLRSYPVAMDKGCVTVEL